MKRRKRGEIILRSVNKPIIKRKSFSQSEPRRRVNMPCYVLCRQIDCDSFNKIQQNESSRTKHFTSESLNSSHRHHFQLVYVV